MVPPISLVSAVSTLLGWSALLSLPASTHALVLPQNGSSTTGGRKTGKGPGDAEGWCTPRFSGLVQGIRSSAHQEIVWKAVATADKAVNDGVRAVNVGRSKSAGLELELEWFVEAAGKGGLFSIISVVALSSDDDLTIPSLTISSQPFLFPQTPSVSHHDRLDSSSDDDFKPSKFCFSSPELPQKPAARCSSAAGTLFDQFYVGSPARNLKLQRNRRASERIVLLGLTVVLTSFLIFSGKKAKVRGRLVEEAKVEGLGSKYVGHGYVTSFPYGGLTNQLIELFKLIHVAQRLDRAAILTELKAVHSEGGETPLSASLKPSSTLTLGTQPEVLSCWGWRDERALERYNVKTHFRPFPGQLQVPSSTETSITFPRIEVLASQDNTAYLTDFANRSFGSIENAPPFPNQQLMCFENLFYVPSVRFVEGQLDTSYTIEELRPDGPVWANAGRHLHFNSHVNHITDKLLTALLGSRRKNAMDEVVETFSAGVKQVQTALQARRKRSKELPVLFATDTGDPASKRGWIHINPIEFATTACFGGWSFWQPANLSTFSSAAARRVESSNGGVTAIVG
ncbi:hypothetical protein JCM21900_005771 [Sporobolomyces salmonicolor]